MIDYSNVYIYTDQPTTCPVCGSRTEITIDLNDSLEQTQHHRCFSSDCNYEFVMQRDDNESEKE
jgi:hypothetical protein